MNILDKNFQDYEIKFYGIYHIYLLAPYYL